MAEREGQFRWAKAAACWGGFAYEARNLGIALRDAALKALTIFAVDLLNFLRKCRCGGMLSRGVLKLSPPSQGSDSEFFAVDHGEPGPEMLPEAESPGHAQTSGVAARCRPIAGRTPRAQ